MELAHFYHAWVDGNWRAPALPHIEALISSGFDGPITVGLVGTPANRAEARDVFARALTGVRFVEADHGHEEHTLRLVREHVNQGASGAVLYAHTHGAWHPGSATDLPRLTRGLVAGWASCLDLLADVDLVGYVSVTLRPRRADTADLPLVEAAMTRTVIPQPPSWSLGLKGNFWMVTCAYLRTLGRPSSPRGVGWQRFANERWVLSGGPRFVWPEDATEADLAPHPPTCLKDLTEWHDGLWHWTPTAAALMPEAIERDAGGMMLYQHLRALAEEADAGLRVAAA